ncbi:MAG TPA: MFS transporter [Thiolinea sp.]|nr:MFS transporter [Thiolinea sp.]
MPTQKLPPALALRIFIPFALGYFLSYLYRVVNTAITTELAGDIGVDAAQLGLLTSVYFITFAAVQIPLGILLDRFGPRRVNALLLLFAALGALVFSQAKGMSGLIIGRALIGFGVSACLMSAFKAFVQWFPRETLPLVNGLQLAAGGLGVLAASLPVEMALTMTDWRGVFTGLAVLTVLAAILVFLAIPDKPEAAPERDWRRQLRGTLSIFTARRFWNMAPVSVATQAAFLATMSLWAGPWLRDVAGMERGQAASTLFWMAIGVIAGYIFLGFVAERLGRSGHSNLQLSRIGIGLFMLVQLGLILELTSLSTLLWILFGFFGTTGVLSYALLSQQFAPELAGRVNTALNLLVFVCSFVAQWGMGAIINAHGSENGHYHPDGYQAALLLMLLLQLLAMAASSWHARRYRDRNAVPDV